MEVHTAVNIVMRPTPSFLFLFQADQVLTVRIAIINAKFSPGITHRIGHSPSPAIYPASIESAHKNIFI